MGNVKRRKLLFVGATVATGMIGLMMSSTASAIITIDNFNVGSVNIAADSGTPVVSNTENGLAAADVIGGTRFSQVTWQSGQLDATINNNPPIGELGLSSSTGVTALFEVAYDADGAGLGGIDLTEGGAVPGFFVQFTAADAGAGTTVTLTDTNANTSSLTLPTFGPGVLFFTYALFDNPGVVETDVDRIDFSIQGQVDGDYRIDLIQSRTPPGVPEPLTAALGTLGLGCLSLGLRRRRLA